MNTKKLSPLVKKNYYLIHQSIERKNFEHWKNRICLQFDRYEPQAAGTLTTTSKETDESGRKTPTLSLRGQI